MIAGTTKRGGASPPACHALQSVGAALRYRERQTPSAMGYTRSRVSAGAFKLWLLAAGFGLHTSACSR